MPRLNGTGPMGQGPMTGRGMGSCGGGMGCGQGFGRRFSGFMGSFQKPAVEDLKAQKEYLKNELNALDQEIANSGK